MAICKDYLQQRILMPALVIQFEKISMHLLKKRKGDWITQKCYRTYWLVYCKCMLATYGLMLDLKYQQSFTCSNLLKWHPSMNLSNLSCIHIMPYQVWILNTSQYMWNTSPRHTKFSSIHSHTLAIHRWHLMTSIQIIYNPNDTS